MMKNSGMTFIHLSFNLIVSISKTAGIRGILLLTGIIAVLFCKIDYLSAEDNVISKNIDENSIVMDVYGNVYTGDIILTDDGIIAIKGVGKDAGTSKEMSLRNIVGILSDAEGRSSSPSEQALYMENGDIITGKLDRVDFDMEVVFFRTEYFDGQPVIGIPLDDIMRIIYYPASGTRERAALDLYRRVSGNGWPSDRTQDILILKNGNVFRGEIKRLDKNGIFFTTEKKGYTFAVERIAAVGFMEAGATKEDNRKDGILVEFDSKYYRSRSSVRQPIAPPTVKIYINDAKLSKKTFSVKSPSVIIKGTWEGSRVIVRLDRVKILVNHNARIILLKNIIPLRTEYIPGIQIEGLPEYSKRTIYSIDKASSYGTLEKVIRNMKGEILLKGNNNGIGGQQQIAPLILFPSCSITWEIPPGAERFMAVVGTKQRNGIYGSSVVSVYLDEKKVFAAKVSGADEYFRVDVETGNEKFLVIQAEYIDGNYLPAPEVIFNFPRFVMK